MSRKSMSLDSMFSLAGKKALIAGASRGIGLAIAKATAAAGAHTILAARSADALEEAVAAIEQTGYSAQALPLDVGNLESINSVTVAHPDIDILVNVAGTNIRKPFEQYTREDYELLMQTNLHGVAELTRKVGVTMIERGGGRQDCPDWQPHVAEGTALCSGLRDDQERTGRADAGAGGRVGQIRYSSQLYRSGIHSHGSKSRDVAVAGVETMACRGAGESPAGNAGRHRRAVGVLERTGRGLHYRSSDRFRRRLHDDRVLAASP